jgi:hypothetical protein
MQQRMRLFVAAVLVAPLGYWMRFDMAGAEWLRDASGGVIYVVFWMLAAACVWPRAKAGRIAFAVFFATCGLEFLQLWHPGWLEEVRRTLPGRLVLGTTFSWSDFAPYAAGAGLGWALLTVSGRF